MSYTTFNVSFYCRESKAGVKGYAPIEMSIVINGERAVITLPRKEKPKEFKASIQAKRNNDVKNYLNAVRHRLNAIITEMMEQGVILTASTLKECFAYGGVRHYTIQDLFDEYIGILRKRVGIDLTPRTFRKYELARDKFYLVIDKAKPLTAITNAVIVEYISALRNEFNVPTSNGYGQRIKTVIRYAMCKGLIKVNPFINVHLRKGTCEIQFLTVEEVNRIRDTDFHSASLNRVRDLFVFQSACGLSYCDMAALVPNDIQFNQDGQPYIHKPRAKTNVYYTSVILEDGVAILKKYGNKLPVISNQKYNAALKFIKDVCGIDKPLHTHIARHTYATRCLNEGIRLEVVAKLLGHSTTRLTQHYAKLLEKNVVKEVQEAFDAHFKE